MLLSLTYVNALTVAVVDVSILTMSFGRWVHVVCALYVSGVAFEDVERLRPVTLTEMPYVKYGAKVTSGIVASVMQNPKVVLGIYEVLLGKGGSDLNTLGNRV